MERMLVGAVETHPLVIEGLQSVLTRSGRYELLPCARSLESLSSLMARHSPAIVIIDKIFGLPSILDWLGRQNMTHVSPVVWGTPIHDGEALRFLKSGARGVLSKTAEPETLLACLDAVASGSTWMEDVLFEQTGRPAEPDRDHLTPREREVLNLVEQGLRNKDIARELGIQPGTVKIHMKHIFEKTGVHGRFSLALSGLRGRAVHAHRNGF